MNIILYSTGCPRCKTLSMLLYKKHIQYTINSDIQTMENLGILSVPVLSVDGQLMPYNEAVQWVNNQGE